VKTLSVMPIAILAIVALAAAPCRAQDSTASVAMAAWMNHGALSAVARADYTVGGVPTVASAPFTISARAYRLAPSKYVSGTTYAELKNNTGSAITLSSPGSGGPASIDITATGTCMDDGTASSTISLESTTATGSCGSQTSYWDPKTQQVYVYALQPGQKVSLVGEFDCSATYVW